MAVGGMGAGSDGLRLTVRLGDKGRGTHVGHADALATGNLRHCRETHHGAIQILSPRACLDRAD
ncbi:MAG: hypothetical protein WAS21_25710 [Geminicoccaceae bacterium]